MSRANLTQSNLSQSGLTLLSDFLRTTYPHDVIIPCGLGDKRPYYPYKLGWTWEDFDREIASGKSFDWAIILHDLCVVDCDSPEAAADLEARFPLLRDVACAKTRKGMHFYFKRSSLADAGGYYDCSGYAQIIKNIDFKSVTSTGTGGIILVTPSTDKEWVRSLWATPLTHIPDNLLTSIARPRAKSDDDKSTAISATLTNGTAALSSSEYSSFDPESLEEVILTFEEDQVEGIDESGWRICGARLKLLRSFDYCSSLLSGRWAVKGSHELGNEPGKEVPTLSMPCKRAVLEEIFSLFEKGELTQKREPTATLLAIVEATADMLGCPPRKINPLLERAAYVADLYKLSPLWWALHREEQKLMLGTSLASSDRSLIRVDEELAQVTGYSPIAKDGEMMWLFPTLPHMLDADTFANFKVFVDAPGEETLKQMPPPVIEILTQHATCTAAAGGAVLGGVTRFIDHGSDVDIFLYGLDHDGSTAVLGQIQELMQSERYADVYDVTYSNAAITYSKKHTNEDKEANKEAWLHDRPFQIILGLHRSRSQIVEYFDISACKVLARMETEAATPTLVVEALPSFVETVRRNAFHVDTLYWSPASVARISKYIAKGFECAVPGVRRAAFGEPCHTPRSVYTWPDGMYKGNVTVTIVELTPKEKDAADQELLKTREIYGPSRVSKGLASLFDMEAEVLRSRAYVPHPREFVEKIEGRLKAVEAATIASKLAGKLGTGRDPKWEPPPPQPREYDDGYDDDDWAGEFDGYGCRGGGPHTNTYGFIRESFRRDVAVRLGDARRDIPISTTFWAFTDAGRFQPTKAFVEGLYNPEKLSALAAEEAATRAEELAGAGEDEIEGTLLDFDEDALYDLFESEGGPFELIMNRRTAEEQSSDDEESGTDDDDTKQISGESDKEEGGGAAPRPSKQPRTSPPEQLCPKEKSAAAAKEIDMA